MNKEHTLQYYEYHIDWSYKYDVVINADDWSYFEIQARNDGTDLTASWHIRGVKLGEYVNGNFIVLKEKEWGHWVTFNDTVKFILWAGNLCRFSCATADQNDYYIKRLTHLLKAVESERIKANSHIKDAICYACGGYYYKEDKCRNPKCWANK